MPNQDEPKKDHSIYQRPKYYIYIISQYIALVVLLFTGPIIANNPVLIFLEIVGIWYLLWVLWTNWASKFDLSYRPISKARLIAKGPYKYIRHPFSSALIIISLTLILNHISLLRLIVWFVLLVVIILRVQYEEKIYSEYYSDFPLYRQKTYRLIPFVY